MGERRRRKCCGKHPLDICVSDVSSRKKREKKNILTRFTADLSGYSERQRFQFTALGLCYSSRICHRHNLYCYFDKPRLLLLQLAPPGEKIFTAVSYAIKQKKAGPDGADEAVQAADVTSSSSWPEDPDEPIKLVTRG